MALTIADAEDAFLSGSTDWEDFLEDYQRQWYHPIGTAFLGAMVARAPEGVREQLRQMSPGAVERVEQLYGGKHARNV